MRLEIVPGLSGSDLIIMYFETGHLYHIYNQGNNRQPVFFSRENYLYFLRKIRTHVLPFADILAWCLMPNHFHLMGYVTDTEVDGHLISQDATSSRTLTFNQSIGIMLASYTRAINKQQGRSGSLFRKETKAICLTQPDGFTPTWYDFSGITKINNVISEKEYPNVCFNYIISNPVKDGLVEKLEEWEFSSYSEMKGIRNYALINNEKIREYDLELIKEGKSGYDFKSNPD